VALDPTLAEAQYELAVWLRWNGGSAEEQAVAVTAALRHADGAPERERQLIQAWARQVAGRDGEALAIYRRVVATWPDEVRAWYQAGDLLRHRDEPAAALPWFRQAAALDPEYGWAAGHLADALGTLGRRDELLAWVRRWEAAPGAASLHGLSTAYGWLGDLAAAARAGERAVALGGGVAGREDQLAAVFFSGRFAEAEREARPLSEPASPVRRLGFYALAALEAYQGRRRAGLAALDELARVLPAVRADSNYHAVRADYLVGDGDLAGVRAEVEALEALDPRFAAEQAVNLAFLGDLDGAAKLARTLPRGSMTARTAAALAAWHRGQHHEAVAALARVCDRTPALTWRMAPLFLLGELLVRGGRDAEGVEALRRFEGLYLWRQMWRSWAWPSAQVRVGEALLRLGDGPGAAAALDRLLDAWRDAEPDAPCWPRRGRSGRVSPPRGESFEEQRITSGGGKSRGVSASPLAQVESGRHAPRAEVPVHPPDGREDLPLEVVLREGDSPAQAPGDDGIERRRRHAEELGGLGRVELGERGKRLRP
jgi:tetratricopeptide (TPR) repeat protein